MNHHAEKISLFSRIAKSAIDHARYDCISAYRRIGGASHPGPNIGGDQATNLAQTEPFVGR
jgi:hypothetical protein